MQESQTNKSTADLYSSSETSLTRSFRNFRFDTASIIRAMESKFVG